MYLASTETYLEERCNLFAAKAIKDPSWAFNMVIKFLQFQKVRVEKEEITGVMNSIYQINLLAI